MKRIFKFIRKIFSLLFSDKKIKENILPEVKEAAPSLSPSPSPKTEKTEKTERDDYSKLYSKPNESPELKRRNIQQIFFFDDTFPPRWRTKLIRH